ncbi:GOLPH3/VPS74 family protein [Spirillospora albida]|uniref:GOLPH3/VPS74 family protein n=1 Tax=Spirillospora albida TaxID=58123 RepID=UPI0004C02874|nr:GPP34 family phosphoprotein [Spirillospora albida]
MTQVPDALPARMYLLAYDLRRRRMTKSRSELGCMVRAAALTELYLDGRLAESRRRPVPGTPGDDPYGLLAAIGASRPRSWQHWVRKDARAFATRIRDELAHEGWIRLHRRRFLGFPRTVVEVRDPRVVKELWGRASSALHGRPVAHVHSFDAAAVALAAACELSCVLPRRERRRHRRRIAELTARSGPAVTAARKVIEAQNAAAAG